jgi:hypothetical protein
MMPLDVVFKFGLSPNAQVLRGLDTARDVYGIRKITFDEKERTLRVEYDGTRLHPDTVAALLRRAGLDLKERVVLV